MLVGDKVVLRTPEVEDIHVLLRWINDREVGQYLMPHFPFSHTEERDWLERVSRSETDRVLLIQARDGQPIGVIGLHRIDHTRRQAELGIFIGEKEYWGRGYGTDAIRTLLRFAFQEMNFHRIYLRVNADNERAQRCYRKCGFVHEGTLREAVFSGGRWRDQHLMAVLAHEFPGTAGPCCERREITTG